MRTSRTSTPNPRRVAAGRRNRLRRGALTTEGRERLRQAALKHRPWRYSTGPRTEAGKARSAANGCWRRMGERSVRQIRAGVADVETMITEMRSWRRLLKDGG